MSAFGNQMIGITTIVTLHYVAIFVFWVALPAGSFPASPSTLSFPFKVGEDFLGCLKDWGWLAKATSTFSFSFRPTFAPEIHTAETGSAFGHLCHLPDESSKFSYRFAGDTSPLSLRMSIAHKSLGTSLLAVHVLEFRHVDILLPTI